MPMQRYDVRHVDRGHEPVLRNLLELYCHDMAEWFDIDADDQGRYNYSTERLWTGDERVYFAYAGEAPVGFALVGSAAPYSDVAGTRDLHEFFVVRRHRRHGLGRLLAAHVWGAHPGPWLVRVYQRNRPALPFWRAAVGAYTGGRGEESVTDVDGRAWSYFTFAGEPSRQAG